MAGYWRRSCSGPRLNWDGDDDVDVSYRSQADAASLVAALLYGVHACCLDVVCKYRQEGERACG